MTKNEIEAIVLDILKKQENRKKSLKKSHGRLSDIDKHAERKERELIEQNDRADFESIYHDYDLDRAVRGV